MFMIFVIFPEYFNLNYSVDERLKILFSKTNIVFNFTGILSKRILKLSQSHNSLHTAFIQSSFWIQSWIFLIFSVYSEMLNLNYPFHWILKILFLKTHTSYIFRRALWKEILKTLLKTSKKNNINIFLANFP